VKSKGTIQYDRYVEVEYSQFNQSSMLKWSIQIAGWISLPIVYPLILIVKISPQVGFLTISEFLSLIPYAMGVIIRYEFYRRTLRSCGQNVFIGFGSVFFYPEISIGSNVLIGSYNTIHHCDFGNNVMVASGCRFLSGSRPHSFEAFDIPMTGQGGRMKHIRIGDDVWIGANAIIMDHVADGSVVAAGSVVNKEVEPYSVVAGNPIKNIRKRRSR
jgi:acetyltransferase-like isoleucine patch superfamily enzyme